MADKIPAKRKQEKEVLKHVANIALARLDFWHFLKIKSPKFYNEQNAHLKTIATALQNLYEEKLLKKDGTPYKKIMLNIPPQFGKSRTVVEFIQWVFGKNIEERIISTSYNDTVSSDFSRYVRDGIQEKKQLGSHFTTNEIFPHVKVKQGNASVQKWALEGQHFSYLGAGIGGSVTSKGGTFLIIDDPIKNAEEAYNDNYLDKVWLWYTSTFLSRVSSEVQDPIEIIIMTRWSKQDLCGRILDDPESVKDWYVLKMEAYDREKDIFLNLNFLNRKRYENLKRVMDKNIFLSNYHQQPIDAEGALYSAFKTYGKIPKDFEAIQNYTDTADEGSDYLCSISYGIKLGVAYVLDIYYTKDRMEITEPETARRLFNNNVIKAKIESNNGGRGFARNVIKEYKEISKDGAITIKWFHQSRNKKARILSNQSIVNNFIIMPADWHITNPVFFKDVMGYMKEGKNRNDDAPDVLTGIAEWLRKGAAGIIV